MLPFVLAAQLALIHGKVFISDPLQGRSQTKVIETFSSRQVSTDNISSQRVVHFPLTHTHAHARTRTRTHIHLRKY